ncbi:MFS transporter [Rhodococcus sp. ACT016]|uniref:MFS transporter n=1 Tax=Rhodococcus sp. ACT016 TaxID=3134808 RepID=UPI003D2C651C
MLAAAAAAQFLVAFDMSVINVALPDIQHSLHFADADLSWVVNAYALAFGGLLMLGGRLCDAVGTRRVLVAGLVIFGVVSVAGTFAPTAGLLVAARALQGVGAAMIAPAGLAALSQGFPDGAARAKAFGIGAMCSALGGALGVVLSGVLTQGLSWRWVMFAGAPVALLAALAAMRGLPRTAHPSGGSLDLPGAVLATAGLTILVSTVIATETRGWGSGLVLGGGAATVALLAAFVVVETRASNPLVRFSTLLRPRIGLANAIMCVVCAGQFGGFFFVSLYMQRGLGYSPATTGVAFLPFCVGLVFGIVGSSKLLPRFGARPLLVIGTALASIGLLGFSTMTVGGSYVTTVLLPSLAASVGIGLSFMPLSNVATADAPPGEVGMASGLLSASRQIGGSVGLAALVSIAAAVTAGWDGPADVALVSGYSRALAVCALLLVTGTVLSLFFPRSVRTATTGVTRSADG